MSWGLSNGAPKRSTSAPKTLSRLCDGPRARHRAYLLLHSSEWHGITLSAGYLGYNPMDTGEAGHSAAGRSFLGSAINAFPSATFLTTQPWVTSPCVGPSSLLQSTAGRLCALSPHLRVQNCPPASCPSSASNAGRWHSAGSPLHVNSRPPCAQEHGGVKQAERNVPVRPTPHPDRLPKCKTQSAPFTAILGTPMTRLGGGRRHLLNLKLSDNREGLTRTGEDASGAQNQGA